jgi:hypothetical protein
MDRSDRLREDQEQLNRNREYQIQDRRSFIRSTKTELRIADLNRQIAAAERQRQRDEAGDEMRAQWPKTRAAVEHCTAVTPELRQAWLDRLESIQYKRSAPSELDDLASDVNRIADGLAKIAQDLDRAAKLRNSYPLAGPLPWPPREPGLPSVGIPFRRTFVDQLLTAILLSSSVSRCVSGHCRYATAIRGQ